MSGRIKGEVLVLLVIALAVLAAAYLVGHSQGKAACVAKQATATIGAQVEVQAKAGKDIKRSTATGTAREADRAAALAFFNKLTEEASHDAPDPVDSCVLPDDRLRRWAAANAGAADSGAAAAQPDGPAAATAAAPLGPPAGPGGEPPGRGPGLSPAGQPAVQAAELPAGAAR